MKYKNITLESKNKAKIIRELVTASNAKKEYKESIINKIFEFEKRFNKSFWNDFVFFRYISDNIEESEIVLGFSPQGVKYNYYDDDLKHIFIMLLLGDDCKDKAGIITFYKKLLSDEETISHVIEKKGESFFEKKFLFKPGSIKQP